MLQSEIIKMSKRKMFRISIFKGKLVSSSKSLFTSKEQVWKNADLFSSRKVWSVYPAADMGYGHHSKNGSRRFIARIFAASCKWPPIFHPASLHSRLYWRPRRQTPRSNRTSTSTSWLFSLPGYRPVRDRRCHQYTLGVHFDTRITYGKKLVWWQLAIT